MKIPEPKTAEIELFGHSVILAERTLADRYNMEDAYWKQNGSKDDAFYYAIILKGLTAAFRLNIKELPGWWRPFERRRVRKWNKLFQPENLRKLTQSQYEALNEMLGELEWGKDRWLEIKEGGKKKADELAERKSGLS